MTTKFPERSAIRSFDHGHTWAYHTLIVLNLEAELARHIADRWALVAAIPDGEDSAGRQKLRLPTPEELAARSCDIAAAVTSEFEKRGWIQDVPPVAEAKATWEENHKGNGTNDT